MLAFDITILVLLLSSILLILYFSFLTYKNWEKSKIFIKSIFNDIKKYLWSFTLLIIFFTFIVGMISGLVTSVNNNSQGLEYYVSSTNAPHATIQSKYEWDYRKSQFKCEEGKSEQGSLEGELNFQRTNCSFANNVLGDSGFQNSTDYDSDILSNENLSAHDAIYNSMNDDPFLTLESETTKSLHKTISWLKDAQNDFSGTESDFIFNLQVSSQFTIEINNTYFSENFNLDEEEIPLTDQNYVNAVIYRAPKNFSKWKNSYDKEIDGIEVDEIGSTYNLEYEETLGDINSSDYNDKVFLFSANQILDYSWFLQNETNEILLKDSLNIGNQHSLEVVQGDLEWVKEIQSQLYPWSYYSIPDFIQNQGLVPEGSAGVTYLVGVVNYDTFNKMYEKLTLRRDSLGSIETNWDAFNFSVNIGFKQQYENYESSNDIVYDILDYHESFFNKMSSDLNNDIFLGDITSYINGYFNYEFSNSYNLAIILIMLILMFILGLYVIRVSLRSMIKRNESNIGTLKALGFDSQSIAYSYSFYPILALLAGSIFGVIFSLFFVWFWTSLNLIFVIVPAMASFFSFSNFVVAILFPLSVFAVYTYFKVNKLLKRTAVSLVKKETSVPNKVLQKFSKYGSSWKFELSYAFSTIMKSLGKLVFIYVIVFYSCFVLVISLLQLDAFQSDFVQNAVFDQLSIIIKSWIIIIVAFTFLLITIVMNNIISDLKSQSSILKSIGYSSNRITVMTLFGYIFLFIFAFLLTVPTLILLQYLINLLIGILASTAVTQAFIIPIEYYVYSFLMVIGMIAISYLAWYKKLRQINPADSLKESI